MAKKKPTKPARFDFRFNSDDDTTDDDTTFGMAAERARNTRVR